MINKVFGQLTVLEEHGRALSRDMLYRCRCNCGKETIVLSSNLKKGNSKSCGCARIKKCSARMFKLNYRHGQTDTKIWRTWKSVVERTTCNTSSHFKRYGGAGILIFDEWLIFENFAKYIGEPPSQKHSIDRIDNSKGYFPGNVRWATAKEQAANRKTNKKIILDNVVCILSDAARQLGISKSTASRWYLNGKFTKA